MVILTQEWLAEYLKKASYQGQIPVSFLSLDEGDVLIPQQLAIKGKHQNVVNGILKTTSEYQLPMINELPIDIDVLLIVSSEKNAASSDFQLGAWIKTKEGIESCPVQTTQVREELFLRTRGLYETDVLKDKTVLVIGLGSGGGFEAIELAKAGVGNFILVDHDRIEVGNVVRHICGLSDLGRYKTKAIRDLILDKNPFANIETHQQQCTADWLPVLRQLVKCADIVFCSTDNRESRLTVNRACVAEQRVCIYAGAFRRAYGGQVLKVIPNQTLCYQCFIDCLPDVAEDQEIASQEQANRIAYSDRLVPIEPGLSTDIASISLFSVKLGILELLRGTETTLASLYQDLSTSWFFWLNRREIGTQYENLPPMNESGDNLRILSWYGVMNEKNPGCPVCGDFIGMQLKKAGIQKMPSSEEIAVFGSNT